MVMRGFKAAHSSLMEGFSKDNMMDAGTCSLLGGIVLDCFVDEDEDPFESKSITGRRPFLGETRRFTTSLHPHNTKEPVTRTVSMDEQDKQKHLKRRQQIVEEILTTETNYVNSLVLLMTHFLQPLCGEKKKLLDQPTADLIGKVTADLNSIISCHQMLLQDLKPIVEKWNDQSGIGSVFEKMVWGNDLFIFKKYL